MTSLISLSHLLYIQFIHLSHWLCHLIIILVFCSSLSSLLLSWSKPPTYRTGVLPWSPTISFPFTLTPLKFILPVVARLIFKNLNMVVLLLPALKFLNIFHHAENLAYKVLHDLPTFLTLLHTLHPSLSTPNLYKNGISLTQMSNFFSP